MNGDLGPAPDSAEAPGEEARFFCVGHDDPRDGADGFFLPAETFRHGMWRDPVPTDEQRVLFVSLERGMSLVVERHPTLGIPSV